MLVSDCMGSPILADCASSNRRYELFLDRVLHQKARSRDAGLAGCREYSGDGAGRGCGEISILEDDVGRLASQLQRNPLETARGGLVDLRAGRVRSRKGDLGDARMRNQFAADLRSKARDHV